MILSDCIVHLNCHHYILHWQLSLYVHEWHRCGGLMLLCCPGCEPVHPVGSGWLRIKHVPLLLKRPAYRKKRPICWWVQNYQQASRNKTWVIMVARFFLVGRLCLLATCTVLAKTMKRIASCSNLIVCLPVMANSILQV